MSELAGRIWLGRLDSFYVAVLMLLNLSIFRGASTAVSGHSAGLRYKSVTNTFTRPQPTIRSGPLGRRPGRHSRLYAIEVPRSVGTGICAVKEAERGGYGKIERKVSKHARSGCVARPR